MSKYTRSEASSYLSKHCCTLESTSEVLVSLTINHLMRIWRLLLGLPTGPLSVTTATLTIYYKSKQSIMGARVPEWSK